jgi:hypothetical protein
MSSLVIVLFLLVSLSDIIITDEYSFVNTQFEKNGKKFCTDSITIFASKTSQASLPENSTTPWSYPGTKAKITIQLGFCRRIHAKGISYNHFAIDNTLPKVTTL